MIASTVHTTPNTTPSMAERFDTPLTLRIGGSPRVFTSRRGVIDALRSLEREERSLNLQAAHIAFDLGSALIEAKDKLGYGHLNHLYNDAGIHRKRAQRCVKFARRYATGDGRFDQELYRQGELRARNRHESGEDPCSFDAEGRPSLSAVMRAEGIRSQRANDAQKDPWVPAENQTGDTQKDPWVPAENQTGDTQKDPWVPAENQTGGLRASAWKSPARALADLAGEDDGDGLAGPYPYPGPLSAATAKGAPGAQMVIDFDLAASERRLAQTVAIAHDAHRRGRLGETRARAINAVIEDAHRCIAVVMDIERDTDNTHA